MDRPLFDVHHGPFPIHSPIECAAGDAIVFMGGGRMLGALGPGRYVLDPNALPFLASTAQQGPGGLWSLPMDQIRVRTDDTVVRAAGEIGRVTDTLTGLTVGVVAALEFKVRVTDVYRAALGLLGMGDANAASQWLARMLLMSARAHVSEHREPVAVGDIAFGPLAQALPAVLAQNATSGWSDLGLSLVALPTVTLALRDGDQARWAAAAEPRLAAQAAGMLAAQSSARACTRCGAPLGATAKFCSECGTRV
jgi:hypothetical protein